MLSAGAFNALLKTLEEPPGHVKFFSRPPSEQDPDHRPLAACQRYDFAGSRRTGGGDPGRGLRARGVKAEPEALRAVARRASGSMRDAHRSWSSSSRPAAGRSPWIGPPAARTASDERCST